MNILKNTFDKIKELYKEYVFKNGTLEKACIKNGFFMIYGSEGECGISLAFFKSDENILNIFFKENIGKDLFEIVRENIDSKEIWKLSFGVCALNAISSRLNTEELLKKRGFLFNENIDFDRFIKKDDVVTLIGFGGIRKKLKKICKDLFITDMRGIEKLFKGDKEKILTREGYKIFSEDQNEICIKKSSSLLITGSALSNNTINELLKSSNEDASVGVYGPSGGILPDILFKNKVNFIYTYIFISPDDFSKIMDKENIENIEKELIKIQKKGFIYRK